MKKGQIAHIVWHDAEVTGEWMDESDLTDHSSTICETVGFIVKLPTKKDPMYIVASTRSGKSEFNAITKIPKLWVTEIKEVE